VGARHRGELEQEVRLLGPSDMRSPFVGWGQIKIREQFDWLAERESRMLVIDELDGVAHSRHERQMHTDDKASVNELLIQVDRVLRLGRMLAATTNYITSLDEALTRSGRFGRFIPVAPPDLDEAVQIVAFYLAALAGAPGPDGRLAVRVPNESQVRAILEPLHASGLGEGRFYCGADLEAAVNGAYV
jgi:SpoVK/Ycf46/Vps4 family AAA+-type ATPase